MFAVDGGHRAVIFDRFRGVQTLTVGEGTHFIIPWVQRPIIFDIRSQPRSVPTITGSKGLQLFISRDCALLSCILGLWWWFIQFCLLIRVKGEIYVHCECVCFFSLFTCLLSFFFISPAFSSREHLGITGVGLVLFVSTRFLKLWVYFHKFFEDIDQWTKKHTFILDSELKVPENLKLSWCGLH